MHRIRTLLKPVKAETPRSRETFTNVNNLMITSSTVNSPRRDLPECISNVTVDTNPPTPLASAFNAPVQSPFDDTLVENLSTHFTGRKQELAPIAKSFERRDIPLRCALQSKSQPT
jgi:hypothetical protein